jgi:hypothetical protein
MAEGNVRETIQVLLMRTLVWTLLVSSVTIMILGTLAVVDTHNAFLATIVVSGGFFIFVVSRLVDIWRIK